MATTTTRPSGKQLRKRRQKARQKEVQTPSTEPTGEAAKFLENADTRKRGYKNVTKVRSIKKRL